MAAEFAGPFAQRPPAELLEIQYPPLDRFGLAELRRIITTCWVLNTHLAGAWLRWLVRRVLRRRGAPLPVAASEAAVTAFGKLGPMFVKLGQLMASSPGLFPQVLSTAAQRCLDNMPPFPSERARRLVAAELGRPVETLFASFDDVPLSAASIAQVHACQLPDGRAAVVKLQRPGIGPRMITDLRIMRRLSRRLDKHVALVRLMSLEGIVEQLYLATCQELNFALEATNQERFGEAVAAFGDNKGVVVPEIYWDYCAPKLICMQRLYGTPMDNPQMLLAKGIEGELPMRRGVKAWLEAAIVHGPFHGDAHAGNLWILDDGRMAFLDFGIMGELDAHWRDLLRDVLYTVMFDRDFERVARGLRRCGVLAPEEVTGATDGQLGFALSAVFGPFLDAPISRLNPRKIIELMLNTAERYSGENPPELTLFAKQLLYFERYSNLLAPDWVLPMDPFLMRNIFPTEASARAAQLGTPMPD
ncbi:AarF/UbiB family protein [Pseudonocardia eucalypti]|uniref:AarF/UbiB family protein n=1 Tax=Pseudonocardia eucalypti TaxID=648755 RepID=A0ABP9QDZ2_9PSEU|nr:putative unusual protein kinase regulating ubiquinone biosynthesis (AarF/ABC1/UbiB family) [Pseudonocardia eucalypti]